MYENRKKSSFALLDEMERNENIRSTDILNRKPRMDLRLAVYKEVVAVAKTIMLLIGAILFCVGMCAFKPEIVSIGAIFMGIGFVKKIVRFSREGKSEYNGK